MTMNLKIRNSADNSVISTEVEESDSIGDLLLYAAEYWRSQNYAMVMKVGSRLVPPNLSVSETGLKDGDTVTVVPDPQGG